MPPAPVTFDDLVRGRHLRRSDRARFLAAFGALLWRPRMHGLLDVVMTLRSGRTLLAELCRRDARRRASRAS